MGRVSRRKLAMYAAERLLEGDAAVIDELAALIVDQRREREIDLLVRDIEAEMAERGTIVATVESARELSQADRQEIASLLSGNVKLRQKIQPELIGGFKLRTPTGSLDATMSKKLHDLRAGKI